MPGSVSKCPNCQHVFWSMAPESQKMYDLLVAVVKPNDVITTREIVEYIDAGLADFRKEVTQPRANTYLRILEKMGLVKLISRVRNHNGAGMAFTWALT